MVEGESTDRDGVFFDQDVQPQFFHLIESAKESIVFVTPYIDLWENLKRALLRAVQRKVEITFFMRKGSNFKPEDLKWLRDAYVNVVLIPNLHAKIYLNESTVIISSMNVLRSSVNDSLEFAMIVENELQKRLFRHYVSGLVPKPPTWVAKPANCIRCRKPIPLNIERPLCLECYTVWRKYGNRNHTEEFCHSCGNASKSTFAKPLCETCLKATNAT